MFKYILGILKNIFNPATSLLSIIDYKSKVDKKAKVWRYVKVFNSKIESFTYIGPNTKIICTEIGKFCSISTECVIGSASHSIKNISTSPIFTSKINATGRKWTNNSTFDEYKKVKIGNDVWIGTRVLILGGVKIGDGAIIGAGSIVTKDVPNYSIVAGIPAKVIKFRFDQDVINELNSIKWWEFTEKTLKQNIDFFQIQDINHSTVVKLKNIIT